jgi:RNA polymerase sigma factor (sigma-70 family)
VLVLRYYDDMSEKDVAEMLGISRGAVSSTAARGLAALRRRIAEEVSSP